MNLIDLFLLAVSLSMDAFSVSICGSLALAPASRLRGAVRFGAWFGFFQFLMPVIGFYCASWAIDYIRDYDHWVAFFLLMYLGLNMIRESREACELVDSYSARRMLTLAVATSIDALAVGISFAFLNVRVLESSVLIGVVTFCFSFAGGLIGFRLGERFRSRAESVGGVVLCLLGVKILLEHLGYL
ncbi:MAG: manganese efflux pump MntP family protein [Succiniclasticum sp.]|jgi:putative Mn2+ efflux pump MntP|nr:manganese efflux pump MntP family protein [Succiniclasticum sp.]MEE3479476.1 manganese efflux pump MntP family protein [Succiniclasticum sp.]